MTLSKTVRRVVVVITALLTLLCQSSALAHTCAGIAAEPAAAVALPPCHDSANDTQGPAHDAHPSQCLSQATLSSPALPDIPPLAGLPALVIRDAFLKVEESALPVSEPPPLRGKPPPLAILHCCLRN